jgi:hypothetical protein
LRRLAAAALAALAVTTAGAATADAASTAGIKAQVRAATGLNAAQFACLDKIVMKESTWNPRATNASSGAYGLVQALPASKMASAGADWRTNPATQARWGVSYMKSRYGSPCAALAFHNSHGWY